MLPLWAISYLSYDKDHMRSTNVWSPFFFFIPSINMKHIRFICLCADFWKSQTLTKSISFHSTRLSYLDFLHSFAKLFVMITFLCKARQWTTSIHCFGLSSFSHEYLLFINYTVTDSIFIYIYIYIFIFSYVSMYIEHTFRSILIEVGAPLPNKSINIPWRIFF